MTATFAAAWPAYRGTGWPVFPLRPSTKTPPPHGATGWDGVDWSGADCAEADELPDYRGTRQTAIRMLSTTVGLDVDAYDDRTGGHTVAEAVRRWGPLPAGPWSSARVDGVSGIRFYRVPDGTVLVPNLAFGELGLGHVELVQRHHRYAVVWPSVHPRTGTDYIWRGTAGPAVPPRVDDLPELPRPWLDGLAGHGRQGERALPEQVEHFMAALPAGAVCEATRAVLRAADQALTAPAGRRHDETCAHVLRLLRCGEQGHTGTAAALTALSERFVRVVTADGSRTMASATAEYDRMVSGDNGVGRLLATPTPLGRRGCRCATEQGPPSRAALTGIIRAVLNTTGDDRRRLLAWATRKLRGYAAAGHLDDTYVRNVVEQLHNAAGGDRQ